MSLGTALVLVFAIAALWGILSQRHQSAQRSARDNALDPQLQAEREAEQRELEELRERVKVLERIAYDANSAEARKSETIAKEIENLRDK